MRKFNDMSPITMCFGGKTNPLIKIGVDRDMTFYSSKNQKLDALRNRKDTDKFIISWAGKWSSDVFEVSENDIEQVLST